MASLIGFGKGWWRDSDEWPVSVRGMLLFSLGASLLLRIPLLIAITLGAPSLERAYGGRTPARSNLVSVHAAVAVLSALCLIMIGAGHGGGASVIAPGVLMVQVV